MKITLKEYIKKLHKILTDNPQLADSPLVYFNDYFEEWQELESEPSIACYNKYTGMSREVSIDTANVVCVN